MDNQPQQPQNSDQTPEQPQIPTQQFFQPSATPGPENPPAVAPTPPPAPKKSKMGLILLLILLVVIGGAAAWYFLMGPGKAEEKTTSSTTPASSQAEVASGQGITSFVAGTVTVDVSHPSSWEVDKTDGSKWVVKSSAGNMLILNDVREGGVGGDCGEDKEYTLIKKLPTQSPSNSFSEYEYEADGENINSGVWMETKFSGAEYEEHNNLKEGESRTGSCYLPSNYPRIEDSVSVNIYGEGYDYNSTVSFDPTPHKRTFEQLNSDPDFLAMLESFKVTIAE